MSKKQGRSFWGYLKTSAKKPFETWKKKPSSEQEGASSTCGTVAPGAAGCSGASQQAHHDQGPKQEGVGTSASGGVAGASGRGKKIHYDKGNTSDLTSPQEKTNYSRLCRLLISVGSRVLRDTFDRIIPPQNLQTILKCDPAHSKLQSRRKEGILNSTQWSKLYPATPSEVSSASFDSALLIVLLRTICNLSPPPAGWDTPPLTADTSRESDIVRVKYFMNTVSKHAGEGSVSDAVFSNYWQQIRDTLVRLGGGDHEDAIDKMKDQEMDPLDEEHFQELFKQWKKIEENMKDKLNELESIEASKEEDSSEQSSASKSKEESPFPGDSVTAFLEWSQSQLRSFYNTSASQVMITPWDPDNTMDIGEVYVQLSLLRDDRKLTGTTKKELKDYSEIFASHGHHLTPKRILVYGRPGIGKSTFSKKLAVDWSRGEKEILKKFAVVLLIKLRDVCNTQDFCAMLKKAELLSADDSMVFNQLYDYVIQNQQKVLLVLDGFDEYSAEKSSPVNQIWRGNQLRDCTVLVTTRPSKENELRPPSHVLFEVNGFDDIDKIKQFAVKFLNGQEDLHEFVDFLGKHELWNMAEIPLLLLLLCLTWKDKGHLGQPTSRADLYESFFQTLLDHVIAKTSDKKFRSIDEYKEDLAKLGQLAFDALLNDCLYLKLSKLPKDIRLLIEKFIAVGFLQISKLSSSPRPEEVAYFLHKTIQEFLSAWFIVQELTNTKKETLTGMSKVDSVEKVKKMEEVFIFVCELSSEATREVFSHLRMIREREGLTEYSFTENPSVKVFSNDQREFHRISLDCFLSCPASDRQDIYPLFLRCVNSVLVIEHQLRAIARGHFLRSSTLPKPDYLFFVNFFGKPANDDVLSIICDLETVVITCYGDVKSICNNKCLFNDLEGDHLFLKKEGQQMVFYLTRICNGYINQCLHSAELLNALVSAPGSPPQKPQNHDASSSLDLTEKTSDHTQKHSLSFVREIYIFENFYGEETMKVLTVVNNMWPFLNKPRVVHLTFPHSNITIEQDCAQLIESLVSRIPFTNNLVILELYNIRWTANSKWAADIARSLHQAPNLDTLSLSSHTGLPYLAENVHHLRHLSKLVLSGVVMRDQEYPILATSLKNLDTLKVLSLSRNPLGHGITELAQHLHGVLLTELDLSDTQMGEKEVTAVARSLQYVPQLKELYLHKNPLGHGITELAKHLHCVPHLTHLYLAHTQMGEEEVTAVARSLQYVPQLWGLYLHENPLGHGITELAKHLHCVPHLSCLDLTSTQMGEEEVTAVARSLQYVPQLWRLRLPENPLGHGITELAKHLRCVPGLSCLDLTSTQMGEEEVTAVARALKYVPELIWFYLSHNPMGRGITKLIQYLSSIPKPCFLTELFGVRMTKKEASELCTATQGNLLSDYQDWNNFLQKSRLYTEAELQERGVTYDDE